jgi:nicotinamide-nucleotide amidase
MKKVFASIITIGDELLIGQVIDTNSAWIAKELNKIGISVKHRVAVGDVWEDIWYSLDEESKHADIILLTGGLGPTADDITKPLLCEYFGGRMVIHQPTLDFVTHLFEQVLQRPMIERNKKQAEVPDICTVLLNEKGTAPGMLFEKEGKIYISMPGVPGEMKWITENHVIPIIKHKFQVGFIEHRTLLTAGIGESFLAEKIKDFEARIPSNLKLAYLPNYGMVRLRLTGFGNQLKELNHTLNEQFEELKLEVIDFLVTDKDLPLEAVVGNLLKGKNQTIATAESCTGGYIAHLLTSIPGSSAYFTGSVVSYSNTIKEEILHVNPLTINQFGAVSMETVTEMAGNILELMNTDYAVAVSGIMGPDGGSKEKPTGLVWIAVASKSKISVKQFNFRYDRSRNIHATATNALNLIRQLIVDNS